MDKGQLLLAGGAVVLIIAIQSVLLIVLERWQRRQNQARLEVALREYAALVALVDDDGRYL